MKVLQACGAERDVLCVTGVYFEKVLKSSETSLWVRNIQMYISGIIVTLIGVYMTDGQHVIEKGFFYGYTSWVCCVVCELLRFRQLYGCIVW